MLSPIFISGVLGFEIENESIFVFNLKPQKTKKLRQGEVHYRPDAIFWGLKKTPSCDIIVVITSQEGKIKDRSRRVKNV